jgi:hypothetical protein
MKFEDAIVKSIKGFLDRKMPESLVELSEEGLTYGPEWFDAFEETIKNGGEEPKKKKKAKKDYEEDSGLGGLGNAK